MLRKKIFKILSVLVAVIIAFSCFCFSVSAAQSKGYYLPMSTPRADNFSGYIELLLEHNTNGQKFVMVHSWQLSYTFQVVDTEYDTDIMDSYIEFDYSDIPICSVDFQLYQDCVKFSVNPMGGNISRLRMLQTTFDTTGYYQYRNLEGSPLSNTFYNPSNYNIISFKIYGNCKVTNVNVPGSSYLSWHTIYSNNSSQDVIDNQDKNASEIKANQDKNTNKIINGGKDNPGYSSVDKSTTDNYQSAEDEINNKTVSARSSTVSFFNNFGALLNDTPVQRGLLAVSKIMTEFFNIGWFAGLIQFALGIGAFAFILGSVIMVVGKISSNKNTSTRNEYYKAKSNYYNSRRRKK